jgi:hypothetical protein
MQGIQKNVRLTSSLEVRAIWGQNRHTNPNVSLHLHAVKCHMEYVALCVLVVDVMCHIDHLSADIMTNG